MDVPVVLFRYTGSPFVLKMEHALAYLDIPHHVVDVSMLANERHHLRKDLGINHRRIPLLAIGKQIFFDTTLMVKELEKLSPKGRSLHSAQATSKAAEAWWEATFFWAAVRVMMALGLGDQAFSNDRATTFGGVFNNPSSFKDPVQVAEARAQVNRDIETLERMVEHTSESQPFIGGASEPSVLDLSVHAICTMAGHFKITEAIPPPPFNQQHSAKFPAIGRYLQRMQSKTNQWCQANPPKSRIAEKDIKAFLTPHPLPDLPDLPRDDDPQGLNKLLGQEVDLFQLDAKKRSQTGTLVYVDTTRFALQVGALRVWAPRAAFSIKGPGSARVGKL